LLEAYSDNQMARVEPIGMATSKATKLLVKVPERRGRIPYRGLANRGVHSLSVRKSIKGTCLKNPQDSVSKIYKIPNVITRDSRADSASSDSIRRSNGRFFKYIF
jgi:hypothetical protein